MNQASLPLVNWQNFYVIVGGSAGALTGLQFVIITLIAQTRAGASLREIRAFGTPTVLHFCAALLLSAIMAMPLSALPAFGLCVAILGFAGLVYSLATIWHARKATYRPDFEDWIWYTVMPIAGHLGLIAAAILLLRSTSNSPLLVAFDTLFFVFLGVRNAWDTVTYIVLSKWAESTSPGPTAELSSPDALGPPYTVAPEETPSNGNTGR